MVAAFGWAKAFMPNAAHRGAMAMAFQGLSPDRLEEAQGHAGLPICT